MMWLLSEIAKFTYVCKFYKALPIKDDTKYG